ncbi:NPCBM/NEW2 domain-containing protein [Streptomyces sp. NPDC050264]|uniref:NPCBM/NEW2 domain-containing protein n=1 Tax=Streptomyces sp. NPDC050264 TaxID=3155038 RepID=UPI0034330C94
MRRLPTRSTSPVRRRVVAAVAVSVLCAGGVVAAPASATASRPAPAESSPALDEGLALTPPMGFNNWNSTHCSADFDESMVKGIADLFVDKGLKDAGYQYVNLDDCWALSARDANGKLVPDPARFPNGIKAVADYVHSKGLKLGIYTSAGTKTCSNVGFPGALGHEYSDARQFADWGVDYLKYDNCNNQGVDAKQRYTTMRDALRATGRPIVYSICEWGENKPWEWAGDLGQLWRTTGDISDSWGSMLSLLKQNLPLAQYAGPGHWNDPDMLEVGNGGMTDTEYRTHFSMWSVMASPLLIGTDLRTASGTTYEILSNRDVIAVDQDPLGKQGTVVSSDGGRWVVSKEMEDGSRTVALFNETGSAQRVATTAEAVGLPSAPAYVARDLWQHKNASTAGTLAARVPAHGTVLLRVAADPKWASYPPAAELGLDEHVFVEPGASAKASGTFANLGRTPARDVAVSLSGPSGKGWKIEANGPTKAPVVPGGKSLRTRWTVSAPAGSATGSYDLTLRATYRSPQGAKVTSTVPVTAAVATAPPSGASALGDLPWLSTTNGYGPVERNTSNGESAAGDGNPLTVGGVVYAKGLGVHAASSVDFYADRSCEHVTAQVGVDDEKGTKGTVTFEVWADDRKAASTGMLTNSDAPQALSADVAGAQVVRLVVTDGGDGIDSDHGDWGDAQLTC